MMKEELYLISICNAYLNKTTLMSDESIDYSRLFSVAKEHKLTAIIFSVIKNSSLKSHINKEVYSDFENAFYETIFRFNAQSTAIKALDDLLSASNIRHVFFKGAEIRNYYPIPEVRAMGDIDILIDEKNRDRVKELLCSNGFSNINSNGPVYDYAYNNVLIEMHTKIISGKVGNSSSEEYFSDAMDKAQYNGLSGLLDCNYHFAYLLTHIAHHFWFYGAGIKLILDLAVMLTKFDIDIDCVLKHMKRINLEKFSKVILTLCYKWFGVGCDFCVDTKETERFICSYGAFGANNKRNFSAVVQRKALEENKQVSSFKTKLRLLFPEYDKIKNIPYISFIEGKPWLLPVAWNYRIIYNLKHRKSLVKQAVSDIGNDKTNEEAQRELQYFEEIGLL